MARKRRSEPQLRGFGTASLASNVSKAESYMRKRQWGQAYDLLTALDQQFPDQEEVLRLLAALYYEIQEFTHYQLVCRRLSLLKPQDGGLTLALGGAYMTESRPTLALQAFRKFLEQAPHHPKASEIQEAMPKLEALAQKVLAEMGLADAQQDTQQDAQGNDAQENARGMEIATLNELAQLYLQAGKLEEAQEFSQQLLALHPTYMPALNNLSLMMGLEGKWEEAIAITHQVLETEPENAHALSNLVRYQFLSGHAAAAEDAVHRLKAIDSDRSDVLQKQAEALSFVGDFDGILEIFQRAEAAEALSVLLYHLAAVAMLRSGKERQARDYWEQALKLAPGFDLAQENLEDLKQSVTLRQAPWAFALNYWISPQASEDVMLLQEAATETEADLRQATQTYLQQHPEVGLLIPALLDRADGAGRQLALNLALMTDTPAMHQILKDFAQSQRGSDEMRQQASQVAIQAGMFPEQTLRFWRAGQWREVTLLGYELHEELLHQHSPEAEKLARQGMIALQENNWVKAEQNLKQAQKLEPQASDINYNLATAYERQGKTEEAFALVRQLYQQDPDYTFARVAIARSHLKKGELAEAEALLQPLADCKRMHYSAFAAFSDIRLELYVAHKNYEAARAWLEMWYVLGARSTAVQYWQTMLSAENPYRRLAEDRGWQV